MPTRSWCFTRKYFSFTFSGPRFVRTSPKLSLVGEKGSAELASPAAAGRAYYAGLSRLRIGA